MNQVAVGSIVHYVAYGTPGGEYPAGVCRAAVVTEVATDTDHVPQGLWNVGLCVLNPTGMFFKQDIPYDAGRAPGSWHEAHQPEH